MVAYTVVDYETGPQASVKDVIAAFETKLETLDTSNNTIYMYGIEKIGTGGFVGWIVYKG